MVIGLLSIIAIPTVTGVALGTREQRRENMRKADERRMARFYIDISCEVKELRGRRVVLRDNKVYLDHPQPSMRKTPAHSAQAFFIGYPDNERDRGDGLVSTVSDDPPMLNWIYVDKDRLDLRYGNRTQSIDHIVGPWDWTEDGKRVTIEGQERFMAVKEEEGIWALYYDRHGDALASVVEAGKAVVEIALYRRVIEEIAGNN
ncbi:hypothetical protein VTN00DRAFT_3540 [Thermoascus crustaceus]|uniref:uncharacterized protein n=1 Tax=Thermoascus crustaceus TaxID=5088 RepID=UPI0037435FD2